MFQAHNAELKRYYDQALRQARSVYYVGIGSLFIGAGVIGGTFALVLSSRASDLSEQIIVGALGAIGAILANFIGVIYLRMFSDTIKAMTGFHGRLVLTHHLHFGNFLAAKIGDNNARDQALVQMAESLSAGPTGSGGQVDTPPPATAEDSSAAAGATWLGRLTGGAKG